MAPQNPPSHTVRAFSEELDNLANEVARMGGLVESQVADVITAVVRRDTELADSVVKRDAEVDAMQHHIEKQVIRLFALRQPLASDLRANVAALKVAADLERVGDLAKNIARRTRELNEAEPIALTRGVERMGRLAAAQLHDVIGAFIARDVEPALRAWRKDDEVDSHYESLFRELLTYMMEDPRKIGPSAHLLFIAKNIERIGDHATNIAEVVHYLVTGDPLQQDPPPSGG